MILRLTRSTRLTHSFPTRRSADLQSSGIDQINRAVTQMDMVTQQNAVLVQEAATSAASLREQVSSVSGAVSAFKTTGREVIDVSAKQIMASAKRPAVANTPAAGRQIGRAHV